MGSTPEAGENAHIRNGTGRVHHRTRFQVFIRAVGIFSDVSSVVPGLDHSIRTVVFEGDAVSGCRHQFRKISDLVSLQQNTISLFIAHFCSGPLRLALRVIRFRKNKLAMVDKV